MSQRQEAEADTQAEDKYKDQMRQLAQESKAYLSFSDEDAARLNQILPRLSEHIPTIVSRVLDGIATSEQALKLLEDHPLPVETAIKVFEKWLSNVFAWTYGDDFGVQAYKIGNVHAVVGVKPKFMSLTMGNFVIATNSILSQLVEDQGERLLYLSSVEKALFLNLTLMLESYETHRLENFLSVTGMSRQLYDKLSTLPW